MSKWIIILFLTIQIFSFCDFIQQDVSVKFSQRDSISKIEMNLSAFGVESDDFPSIYAYIDFVHDSSHCVKSYYNPKHKDSVYHLSRNEIENALNLLRNSDLRKLKDDYKINRTDQPTSTIVIYTDKQKFIIKDYGLAGDYPLQDLYKIVYKL